MRFTRRTYRVARNAAIRRIMDAGERFERIQTSTLSTDEQRQDAIIDYDREVDLGMAIVDRARREKGMFKA